MPDTAKPKSHKASVEKRTVSLPAEQAAFIDAKVAAGEYASASEVVRDGLRTLQSRDAALENFLRTEVVAAYEAMKANPERGRPIEQAFTEIKAKIAARRATPNKPSA